MPSIVQYVANKTLAPATEAEGAALQRGRRAGSIGNEAASAIRTAADDTNRSLTTLGEAVSKHAAQHEITVGFSKLSDLADSLDTSLRSTLKTADPFDPDAAKKWREETLNPALQDFRDQFSTPAGKEWAAGHAGELATHLYRGSVAEEMNRQGTIATGALEQASNKLSNVATKPGGIDTALSLVPGTMKALIAGVPGLSPEQQQKYATELQNKLAHNIVQSGLQAAVDNDPKNGFGATWKPEYANFLKGEEVNAIKDRAIQRQHIQLETQNLTETMKDRTDRLDFQQKVSGLYNAVQLTPNGIVVPPDLLTNMQKLIDTHPGAKFEPFALRTATDWAKAIQEEHTTGRLDATDPQLRDQLGRRLFAESNPLTVAEVDKLKIGHQISDSDYMRFRQAAEDDIRLRSENPEMHAMVSNSFAAARNYIDPKGALGAALDFTGAQGLKTANWERWAMPQYFAMTRAGTPPAEALAKITDPKVLDTYKNGAAAFAPPVTVPAGTAKPPLSDIWK